jgi:riboflavin synthase alpha subunit
MDSIINLFVDEKSFRNLQPGDRVNLLVDLIRKRVEQNKLIAEVVELT